MRRPDIRPGVQRLVRLALRRRDRITDEASEELRLHIELRVEQLVARGLSPEAAHAEATRRFHRSGSIDEARQGLHTSATRREDRMRIGEMLDSVRQDLHFALRGLRRTPGFTAVAVLSLALGIGANAAVFSVVNAMLLQPLPYTDPQRLVSVRIKIPVGDRPAALPVADLRLLEQRSKSFSTVGAYSPLRGGVVLTAGSEARSLVATGVTAGVFPALGIAPLLGRTARASEDRVGGERVVVLSHSYWRDHFSASTAALGQSLVLDGEPHTIIGVMPAGFSLPALPDDDLWPVLQLGDPDCRCPFWLTTVARLAPGMSTEQARAESPVLAAALREQFPETKNDWSYVVRDLKESIVGDSRATVLLLYGAVALVLLITAANLANLFLARAAARGAELAVRSALGASRKRLARQLVTESVLVTMLGGALGLALAVWITRLLPAFVPDDLPRLGEVRVDGTVLLVTAAVALLTGIVVGLVPAIQLPGDALDVQLREGGRGATSAGRRRLRSALVVTEFAVALTVLIGAGLAVNSLVRLQHVDAGVREAGVVVSRVTPPTARYERPAQIGAFHEEVLRRASAVPGVRSAALSMSVPPSGGTMSDHFSVEGGIERTGKDAPLAQMQLVTPGYFTTLGVPIRRGRLFADTDREGSPQVAIVNETLVRQAFGDQDPIGRWVKTGDADGGNPKLQIVGVVADVKYEGLDAAPEPAVYQPYAQNLWWRSMYLVVRTTGAPLEYVPSLRRAVTEVDPLVPLNDVRSMDQLLDQSVARPRFRATLLAACGALALVLASAGIYGVMSYTVSQRRREIGVRLALGASRVGIVGMMVRDGMRLAVAGVVFGLALALAGARLLRSVLFEVSPMDPTTYALMALFLTGVGLAACAIPARRASRTDPTVALRAE
jgi:predicted permease